MYEITVNKSFSAAHIIKDIGGKCEELHGHNFIVEVSLAASTLNKEGLLIDFRIVKGWIDELFEALDHKYLNEHPYFMNLNPSAENLARFIHDKINEKAQVKNIGVSSVTVWESESARATYRGKSS